MEIFLLGSLSYDFDIFIIFILILCVLRAFVVIL